MPHRHAHHHHGHPHHGEHDHGRRAVSLEDGAAHDADHALWTRRDFLVGAGLTAASAPFLLGSTPARALRPTGLLGALAAVETDRVLVLVQLKGGNDGLNTVVPFQNDVYHQSRPTVRLAPNEVLRLTGSDEYGLHPSLGPFRALWDEGRLGVVHTVGYPDHNGSHFRGTDIWVSSPSPTDTPAAPVDTGWIGRAGESLGDGGLGGHPVAIQLGTSLPLLFQSGDGAGSGFTLQNPGQIDQIALRGALFDPIDSPQNAAEAELAFVRQTANFSIRYLAQIQDAARAGANAADYPGGALAEALAVAARLVKGGLRSRVVFVSLGGFDTHGNQLPRHAALLDELSGALAAFYADLAATGHDERVLTATFSEFGRRVADNGSGTDHGAAAPLFVLGAGVEGGFYGQGPDLEDLAGGSLRHSVDFREVYAALLGHWLGLGAAATAGVLGAELAPVPFVREPGTGDPGAPAFPAPGTAYLLRHAATGLHLDADPDGVVGLSASAAGLGKQWRFPAAGGGRHRVVSAMPGRGALDTSDAGAVRWVEEEAPAGDDKLWTVEAAGGAYRLRNGRAGRGWLAGSAEGAVLWTSDAGAALLWEPTAAEGSEAEAAAAERAEESGRPTAEAAVAALELALRPPYPNPARGAVTVPFSLPTAAGVELDVVDALGRQVAVVASGDRPAGAQEERLEAGALAPGSYFVRLRTGTRQLVRSLTVAR